MKYTFLLFFFCSVGITSLQSQIVINEIRILDSHVELKNLGASTVDIGSYWLCQFPTYDQLSSIPLVCPTPSGDLMVEAGTLVTVNLSYSLDPDDGELALYVSSDFNTCAAGAALNMIDYVEWGSHGHTRSGVAECEGIWANNDFVLSWTGCASLEYDGSGNASSNWISQNTPSMPCVENTLDGCGAMPLDLLSFKVEQVGNGARIEWKAIHEPTIVMVHLEHSMNTTDWTAMTEWQPTGPDFDYGVFNQRNVQSGIHYYRLATNEQGGTIEYSDIKALRMCFENDVVNIWPNPTSGMVDIFIETIEPVESFVCELFDAHGKVLMTKAAAHHVQFDLSPMSEGVYFLHIPALGVVQRVIRLKQ